MTVDYGQRCNENEGDYIDHCNYDQAGIILQHIYGALNPKNRGALSGKLHDVEFRIDETFGFEVPVSLPGVDSSLLDPRSTWADPASYDEKARELAGMFRKNFEKFADAGQEVVSAGPKA